MKKSFLLFLILYSMHGYCQDLPPAVASTRQALLQYQQRHKVPGVMSVVYYEGRPYFLPLGSVNGQTEFGIGSITKSFTAIILAAAVQDGRVTFDEPVAPYLRIKNDFSGITFRHLATHTSGLPRVLKGMREMRKQEVLPHLNQFQVVPGKKHLYSNLGFGLLGMALEDAFHQDYEALLARTILIPLHMNHTHLRLPQSPKAASGGIISTGEDMSRFLSACLGLPGTPPKLLQAIQLTEEGSFKLKEGRFQALSWVKHQVNGYDAYVKNGGVPGFSSFMGYIPALKSGVVIMANKKVSNTPVGLDILNLLANPQPFRNPGV